MMNWSDSDIAEESNLCDSIIEAGVPALHALHRLQNLTGKSHNGDMDNASCALNDAIDAVILVLAEAVKFQKEMEGGEK